MEDASIEPGSFRDPASKVFYSGDAVLRALTEQGLADFESLAATGLYGDPRIVETELLNPAPAQAPSGAVAVLRHERVPFISYPYEWTFSMLKDAALLQLDLILDSLDEGLMLKDATPYNVQFVGSRPMFIDIGSFERLHEEELWVGYRQFCMLQLYPLLLQARGASLQPLLRGSVHGITPAHMRGLASMQDVLRRGYQTHVFLQSRLESRPTAARGSRVAEAVRRPGLGTQLIRTNVRKMHRLVSRLDWAPRRSTWLDYGRANTYSDQDAARKDDFVRTAAASVGGHLAWDLGGNTGRHARLVADSFDHVLAIDADPASVELLYRELKASGDSRILPLVVDLTDPSPGLGWRGVERRPLLDRGRPDLVLALALVHHLAIAGNVPVPDVVAWFAELGGALVVELPTREDAMVQSLLERKRSGLHPDYERATFERCLADAFDIRATETLSSGTRILYFCTARKR